MYMISIFICYVNWDEQNEYHTKVHNITYIYSIFHQCYCSGKHNCDEQNIFMAIAKTTKSNK